MHTNTQKEKNKAEMLVKLTYTDKIRKMLYCVRFESAMRNRENKQGVTRDDRHARPVNRL